MTIRELTAQIMEILSIVDSEELDADILRDTLEVLAGAFEDKADAYAELAAEIQSDVDKLDAEIRRLMLRRSRLVENKKRVLKTLMDAMETTGNTKFKTALHSFSIVSNGGKLPVILDVDVNRLPDSLVKLKREANNEEIRKYLDAGDEHVKNLAHYGERGRSLRIK